MKTILLLLLLIGIQQIIFAQDSVVNYTDINGMKQGYWVKTNEKGEKVYEGNFKNNIPFGEFKRFHANGALSAKMFFDTNDQKRSSVEIYDDRGELGAKGFYYNKKKDSTWLYYGANEKLIKEENYKNGKLNGVCKVFYPNGQEMEVKGWKDGKMDGPWIWYFEDGTPRLTSEHSNDKRTGEFTIFYNTGKVYIKGEYKNDFKHGKWYFYNEDGEEEKTMKFKNGEAENQEEIDKQVTKELEDMELKKGTIAEPTEEDMFNGGNGR